MVLIGVDHNFSTKGPANQTIISDGADPNYFGKGFKWQLPELESSEIGYRTARTAYENSGREIIDATFGGKLQVFTKTNFTSLFRKGDSLC